MTEQYLVAIYHVPFLVEQLSYVTQTNLQLLDKVFRHKRGYFALADFPVVDRVKCKD